MFIVMLQTYTDSPNLIPTHNHENQNQNTKNPVCKGFDVASLTCYKLLLVQKKPDTQVNNR